MYKIIGADGKEYGPVSADQLRQWLREGRVNSQTKVQPEGATEWQTLSALPEFAAETSPGPVVPPSAPSAGVSAKTSALAIVSLALGVLGLFSCGITALVGLVLGIVALVRIKRSEGRLAGDGFAIAGIIVSALFLLTGMVLAGMMLPALTRAKQRAQTIACVNNVKQLNLALIMYANDNSNQFPSAGNWCDAVQPYGGSPGVFLCPAGDASKRCHYAFNARLDGAEIKAIRNPAKTVLVFETDGGWNVSGSEELARKPWRHGRILVVGFADGHVEQVSGGRLQQLQWGP